MQMTVQEFEKRTGRPPEHDDLERVNCDAAGSDGHRMCGWCVKHDAPFFECLCGDEARGAPGEVDENGTTVPQ